MRKLEGPGSSRAGLVGMLLVLAGCAQSAVTKPPAMPSLPPASAGAPGEKQAEASKQATPKSDAAAEARRSASAATGGGPVSAGEAKTPDEQRTALDGQLQASMTEFDGMLLKEQKALEDKQRKEPLPQRGEGAGGGAGGSESSDPGAGKGGAGKPGSAGSEDDRTPAERRAEAEAGKGKAGDKGTGDSKDGGQPEGGAPVTAPVEGGPAGAGSDSRAVPPDVGDGRNDDVVARQLREAATKEKDPAIRAKLWDEYREYKKSVGKGGN